MDSVVTKAREDLAYWEGHAAGRAAGDPAHFHAGCARANIAHALWRKLEGGDDADYDDVAYAEGQWQLANPHLGGHGTPGIMGPLFPARGRWVQGQWNVAAGCHDESWQQERLPVLPPPTEREEGRWYGYTANT